MNPPALSTDAVLAQLRLIVFAMIGGLVTFSGVAFFVVTSGFETDPKAVSWLYPALGAVMLIAIIGGSIVRRVMVGKILRGEGVSRGASRAERMAAVLPTYRTWTVASAALAEAPAIFGIVAYLVSGNPIGLLVTALGIIRLVMMLPSEAALENLADAVE